MSEDREVVERRDGVTVSVELKRGTGTRDQDKLSGTIHAEDMNAAQDKASSLMELLKVRADQARNIGTEADDGD